jgi:hypothetical protein
MREVKWNRCAILTIAALAVLSLSGCIGRYTGGGSIDSTAGALQKATFGFVIDAMGPPDAQGFPTKAKGQFQYNDHGAGVSFHVDQLTPTDFFYVINPNGPNPILGIQFDGTYSSVDGQGLVTLGVSSHDQTDGLGDVNQDSVIVVVLSGPFAGYGNGGLVQHGTIQFRPAN